jgi:hypothetical protein
MSEDFKKQLDEWEKNAHVLIKKAKGTTLETSEKLNKQVEEAKQEGKKYLNKLDEEIKKAEVESRETLKNLREKTNKSIKALDDIWN